MNPQEAMRRSMRRLTNLVQQPTTAGWYRVVRNDAGPTRVDIYDEIGGSWLFGGVSAVDFVAELATIPGDIEVHINSPGGDVFDGLAIYNSLAQRPGNVVTVIDGLAASAASFIAQAGKVRVIAPGAMMMIHDASGMCMGNSADMRELADLLDKVSDNLAGIYADRTGRPDGWRDAMRQETWYTASEAVAAGLAHKLAERPEDAALAAVAKFDLSGYQIPDRIAACLTGSSTQRGEGEVRNGPYEPQPYKQGEDETVHCPVCGKYDAPDARYCDQCGTKLVGREDVEDSDGDDKPVGKPSAHTPTVLGVETMPILDKAMPVHHTAVDHSKWDGPAAVSAMPNDDKVLRYCHAWMSDEAAETPSKSGDDDADDQKRNYKFPHHKTEGGPANLNACRNGLARLDHAKIPEADKAGVRAHLQAHLNDAKPEEKGDGDSKKADTGNHAELPAWLNDTTNDDPAGLPAWLQ